MEILFSRQEKKDQLKKQADQKRQSAELKKHLEEMEQSRNHLWNSGTRVDMCFGRCLVDL